MFTRMVDKRHYLAAQTELDSGSHDAALMAKASALTNGDAQLARAKYVQLRAEELARGHVAGEFKSAAAKSRNAVSASAPMVGSAVSGTWKFAKFLMWLLLMLMIAAVVRGFVRDVSSGSSSSNHANAAPLNPSVGTTTESHLTEYNDHVKAYERQFPELDNTSPLHNFEAVELIEKRIEILEAQGVPDVKALDAAVVEYANSRNSTTREIGEPAMASAAAAIAPSPAPAREKKLTASDVQSLCLSKRSEWERTANVPSPAAYDMEAMQKWEEARKTAESIQVNCLSNNHYIELLTGRPLRGSRGIAHTSGEVSDRRTSERHEAAPAAEGQYGSPNVGPSWDSMKQGQTTESMDPSKAVPAR